MNTFDKNITVKNLTNTIFTMLFLLEVSPNNSSIICSKC